MFETNWCVVKCVTVLSSICTSFWHQTEDQAILVFHESFNRRKSWGVAHAVCVWQAKRPWDRMCDSGGFGYGRDPGDGGHKCSRAQKPRGEVQLHGWPHHPEDRARLEHRQVWLINTSWCVPLSLNPCVIWECFSVKIKKSTIGDHRCFSVSVCSSVSGGLSNITSWNWWQRKAANSPE